METIYLLSFLISLASCIFLFVRPKLSILLMVVLCILDLGFFSRWLHVPRLVARIPFFLGGIVGLRCLGDMAVLKRPALKEMNILVHVSKYVLFLGLIAMFSTVANRENFVLGFFELRYYFLFLVLSLGLHIYRPLKLDVGWGARFIVLFGLVQIPFVLIQYSAVEIFGVRLSHSALDMASGTFVSYSELVFLLCIGIGIVFNSALIKKRVFSKANNYAVLLGLIFPLLFSYSRTATAYVLLIMGFVFIRQCLIQKKMAFLLSKVAPALILMVFVGGMFYQFFWRQHRGFQEQLNIEYVVEYFMKEPQGYGDYKEGAHAVMGRTRAIYEASRLIFQHPFSAFFGLGSGSVSESQFVQTRGRFAFAYGEYAGIGRVQVSQIIVEYGMIGLLIHFFGMVYLLKISKHAKTTHGKSELHDLSHMIIASTILLSFYGWPLRSYIAVFIFAYLINMLQCGHEATLGKAEVQCPLSHLDA